jgi:DNA-binding NarL/FixJ family response regulator
MDTVRVALHASDRISLAGLRKCLTARPEVIVSTTPPPTGCDVVVAAVNRVTAETLAVLRRWKAESSVPVVLVADDLAEADLMNAVECRVVAVIPRRNATADRLLAAVRVAASGGGMLPPDLLGNLLAHVGRLQSEVLAPRRLNASGLTPREVDVLRLVADGWDTGDIAEKLSYSVRTVKNVLYTLTNRLKLRNRIHAVAYAMQAGVL